MLKCMKNTILLDGDVHIKIDSMGKEVYRFDETLTVGN